MCTGGPVWGCLCVCGRKRGMEDKGGGDLPNSLQLVNDRILTQQTGCRAPVPTGKKRTRMSLDVRTEESYQGTDTHSQLHRDKHSDTHVLLPAHPLTTIWG